VAKRRFDFCWHCGAITHFHCARCHKPVCVVVGPVPAAGCAVLRRSPRAIGVFLLVCSGRCRKRRAPEVLAVIERAPSGRQLGKNEVERLFEQLEIWCPERDTRCDRSAECSDRGVCSLNPSEGPAQT